MKTFRTLSRRCVFLAAGLFSGLTLNPTAALHAQGTTASPEAVCPANLFTPPTGVYGKDAASPDIVWPNGVRCRYLKIEFPSNSLVPPPAGSPAQTLTVDCTARLEVSKSGAAYQAMTLPGVVTVRITPSSTGTQTYDTEMLALSLTGPGLFQIRESPTLQSTGVHTVRAAADGSFRVGSFFDIFTEVSLDAGATWSPAAAAVHCPLSAPGECATTSFALPPVECVTVCPTDVVFPNGIVVRNVRLRKPNNSLPPPPPGGAQVVSFTGDASGEISSDGGATFSSWGGEHCWDGTCRYASQIDSAGVRFFDTEMLALSLSGGGLPPGVMIRESPTKQSLGRTSVRLAPDGQYRIGSFFDVFCECSVDGGMTWSPSVGSPSVFHDELASLEPVAYVWPTGAAPLAGDYAMPPSSPPLTFAAGGIEISSFSWGMSRGGAITSGPGGSLRHSKRGEAEVNLIAIGGSSWVRAEVVATIDVASTASGEKPMECVTFDFSGGTLPAGVMLRESPTLQSTGKTSVRLLPSGHYEVSSFFDIFTEVSLDGGATWSVANDPLRLTLAPPVEVDTFDSDFFPPRNGVFSQGTAPYYRPVDDVTSYGASGIQLRHFRYHQWTRSTPPPAMPGMPQFQDVACEMVCEISFDGGLSYSPVTTPASGLLRTTRRGTSIAAFETEMLSLNVIGGSLPPGVMIRESPTKQSLGQLRESPSLPKLSEIRISSFFDIFTEISIDGGATWTPSDSSTHLELSRNVPEVFSSSDWLPLGGQMEGDEDSASAAYFNGAGIRTVHVDVTDDDTSRVPPPAPLAEITKVSAITIRIPKFTVDGGATYTDVTASGTQTVRTTGSGGGGGGAGGSVTYDTEMLQLSVSGGTLPPGVMIRESPTLQSTGKHTLRAVAGGYRIGSFFDIFTEVSLDGGATWSECDAPLHVEHIATGEPKIVESNLLPPPGDFLSPAGDSSLRTAPGQHIKSVKFEPRSSTGPVLPPPPGGSASGSQLFELSFLYSTDDGATYQHHHAPATCFYVVTFADLIVSSYSYRMEITELQIGSGTLPGGTMIRESPTKQSLGRTVSQANPDGTFRVSSFFDIFTELSVDGGATWQPFDQAMHVELEHTTPVSPVATDAYPPPDRLTQRTGASLSFPALTSVGSLDLNVTAPPAPRPPLGASALTSLSGSASLVLSVAGGPPLTATCPASALVSTTHTYVDGTSRLYDTEMLSLQLSGGGLPAGVMIRESPTLQSTGKTTVRTLASNFAIDSFFDVFCEISLDGGASWSPSDGPVRVVFPAPPSPPVVTVDPATGVTYKSATLTGTANPGGHAATAAFHYGPTTAYGGIAEVALSPDNGTTPQSVSAALTGLLPATKYHFLLSATNADGTSTSEDVVFTTPDKPFRIWKLTYLGDADAPDLGTPDNDGITNLVKYGLVLTPGSSSVHLLPQPQARTYADGRHLAMVFLRDPLRSDVTIRVQFARSLFGPWTTVATSTGGAMFSGPGFVDETDTPGLAGIKTVEARDPVPMASVSFSFAKITYNY